MTSPTGYVNGQFVIGTIAAASGQPLTLQDSGDTVALIIETNEIVLQDSAEDYYVIVTNALAIMHGPGGVIQCTAIEVLIEDGTSTFNFQCKSTFVGIGNVAGSSFVIVDNTGTVTVQADVDVLIYSGTQITITAGHGQTGPSIATTSSLLTISGINPDSGAQVLVGGNVVSLRNQAASIALTIDGTQMVATAPGGSLTLNATEVLATAPGGSLTLNATQVILSNGAATAEILLSSTPELDLIVGPTAISIGTAFVQVTTPSSGSGVSTNVISFVTTGTLNTQLATAKRYLHYERTMGGGGSVTLTIPFTNNPGCVLLEITTLVKVVTGGTATTAGDSWIQRGFYAFENNGSLVQTGAYSISYSAFANSNLVDFAVSASVSGTTATILFTPSMGSFGTIGTADVEMFADAWLN